MKNSFGTIIFLLLAAMVFAGCSEHDNSDVAVREMLYSPNFDIVVADVEPATRVSYNGNIKKFDTGDAIGVTILKDGAIWSANNRYVYDAATNKWTPREKEHVLADADLQSTFSYLIYAPYTDKQGIDTVKTLAGLRTVITPALDQSSDEAFESSDLCATLVKGNVDGGPLFTSSQASQQVVLHHQYSGLLMTFIYQGQPLPSDQMQLMLVVDKSDSYEAHLNYMGNGTFRYIIPWGKHRAVWSVFDTSDGNKQTLIYEGIKLFYSDENHWDRCYTVTTVL